MKSLKFRLFLLPFLITALFLSACDDDSSSSGVSYSGQGSVTFIIRGRIGDHDTVEATVYNENDEPQKVLTWSKDDIPEQIDEITAGPSQKLVILRLDGNGIVLYRGESARFNLKNNQTRELGDIVLSLFQPRLLSPSNGTYLNGDLINFEWEVVEGADGYRFIVKKGQAKIIDEIVITNQYQIEHFYEYVSVAGNQVDSSMGEIAFSDTEQEESYIDTAGNYPTGQDADYHTEESTYMKYYANGADYITQNNKPISYSWEVTAVNIDGKEGKEKSRNFDLIWGVVKDSNTGLVWEIKTTDGSIHDTTNTYSWNELQDHVTELNNMNFNGINTWRIPRLKELLTLVNHQDFRIAVDIAVFINCGKADYWTSTYYAKDTEHVWTVDFSDGRIFLQPINILYSEDSIDHLPLRAVSGTFPVIENPEERFIDNDDGTISDQSTGLMWQKISTATESWGEGLEYCESLILKKTNEWTNNEDTIETDIKYSDWRLPNKNELLTIVDYSSTADSVCYLPGTEPSGYWTSTTYQGDRNYLNAWAIDFETGMLLTTYKALDAGQFYYVRAVRGGLTE